MHAVICYKNFAANRNISHIGLGVAALNNSKCLSREGITTDVWPNSWTSIGWCRWERNGAARRT